jgi:cell division initiation protein
VPYTPVELRHVRLGRSLFGFKRDETERLLEEVADSFEAVWRDRGELTDKLDELEKRLAEFKEREQLLASTLVAAERAAAEAREAARREAELVLAEAHHEARLVTRGAHGERDRLVAEARRVETLLRSALGMVEESVRAGDDSDSWPNRSDTREFEAIHEDLAPARDEPDEGDKPAAENDAQPAGEAAPGRDFTWE